MSAPADRGQAAVELALSLPLVALVLLGAAQVVTVARDQIAVIHAAREVARAAAVSDTLSVDGMSIVAAATDLEPDRVSVIASFTSDRVRAEVRYRSPTTVPIVGALLPDIELTASATMAREPSPARAPP